MTSDERKTLEALAGDENDLCTTTMDERAAIRSALAEVDALTQQVATLTTERDEAHRLAVESKRKMDAAYAHADLIQSEMTTATDDCPHPSDTWTTCSACHLKAMRERDAACAQVADLEARAKAAAEAFESIDKCLAFSSRDHGLYRGDAWVYGIVCGWEHGDSKAMDEMAARHGWDAESVARLRRLHKAGVALSAATEAT